MAGLLRAGSATRIRGVQRRGAGRPSGSTTRGWISPSLRIGPEPLRHRRQHAVVGQAGVVVQEEQQVARRPAARPRSGRPECRGSPAAPAPRTPPGRSVGSQPLPTTTMSVVTPRWACSEASAAREIVRSPPLGQHDTPYEGPRPLSPGSRHSPSPQPRATRSTATRWPTTVNPAATTSPMSRHLGRRTAEEQVEHGRRQDQEATTRRSGRRDGTARSGPRCRARRSRPPAGARTSSASRICGSPA